MPEVAVGAPAEQAAWPALELRALTRRFGGVLAVNEVSLNVRSGESLGVVGPNGAGKSTLVGLISGALAPSAGQVLLFGQDVSAAPPDARTRLGVGRTHQVPRPFARMSVRENLLLALRHARTSTRAASRDPARECRALLERTGLADVAGAAAGELPLLRRKRLELARALALRPRILLLDEIGAGLVDAEIHTLIDLIRSMRAEVEAMLIIEHVMELITACCERTAVLTTGSLLLIGPTREVLADPAVIAAYLGTRASSVAGSATQACADSTAASSAASTARPRPPLLELRALSVNYGGVRALRALDLTVHAGECVALLGANGAGKSTAARAISGVAPIAAGTMRFDGADLRALRPEQITALGIGHCLEGRRIFSSLSVEENLLLGLGPADRITQLARLDFAYRLFPDLHARRANAGNALSGGQQQMLAIARALMRQPRLVIFDEISLGLAPIAIEQLYLALQAIRAQGIAMLLVEQSIDRALSLADRACVLVHGEKQLEGTPAAIAAAPELRALYVGG